MSSAPPSTPSATGTVLALLAALLMGSVLSLQGQVNGQLAARLGGGPGGGIDAAVISFVSGWLVLTVLWLRPGQRRGLADVRSALRSGRLRPWQVLGGLVGAYLVTAQCLTVATIGVALFSVSVVAGQSVSGLWVDHVGLGPAGRMAVSPTRAVGALLAVAAVALSVSDRLGGASALTAAALALTALPLLAGLLAAGQQAVNGHVAVVGGPFAAAWINFSVGTAVLVVVAGVVAVIRPATEPLPNPFGEHWWLFTGGIAGVVFVTAVAMLVRYLGVLLLTLATVCGQVLGALVLDLLVADTPVGAVTLAGAALTLVGAGLATVGDHRSRRRAAAALR